MFCTKCHRDRMRRIKREGFLQVWLAPLFGYYPWQCSNCATEHLLRARGKQLNMSWMSVPGREGLHHVNSEETLLFDRKLGAQRGI